ncbi:MAG: saccharopine dehydrogenase family protein [Candidatus Hodarchaeota archaeon]
MRIIVLGGGLVGSIIAKDLAEENDFDITLADVRERRLRELAEETKLNILVADLSDPKVIQKIIADQDLVVGALPGSLGINMLRTVIEAGKNIVDVTSSGSSNQLELNGLAREKGVTAITTMGVAPGMTNLIVGHLDNLLDETEKILILVGGLPVIREWPFEYKITWSAADLLRMYSRSARYFEYGQLVEKPALSEVELVNLPGVGTLEAFNTDGLGSLIHTLKVPDMKEKTLRYPGHAEKMQIFKEAGFFSEKLIDLGGGKIKPITLAAKILSSALELKENEEDLVIMRIIVEGKKGKKRIRYTYNLLDYFDKQSKITAMARNTAFPCAIMARLVARGEYSHAGISPPEYISRNEPSVYTKIMQELEKRQIHYKESIVEI